MLLTCPSPTHRRLMAKRREPGGMPSWSIAGRDARIEQGGGGKGVLEREVGSDQASPLGPQRRRHHHAPGRFLVMLLEDLAQFDGQMVEVLECRRQELMDLLILQPPHAVDDLAARAEPSQKKRVIVCAGSRVKRIGSRRTVKGCLLIITKSAVFSVLRRTGIGLVRAPPQ